MAFSKLPHGELHDVSYLLRPQSLKKIGWFFTKSDCLVFRPNCQTVLCCYIMGAGFLHLICRCYWPVFGHESLQWMWSQWSQGQIWSFPAKAASRCTTCAQFGVSKKLWQPNGSSKESIWVLLRICIHKVLWSILTVPNDDELLPNQMGLLLRTCDPNATVLQASLRKRGNEVSVAVNGSSFIKNTLLICLSKKRVVWGLQ